MYFQKTIASKHITIMQRLTTVTRLRPVKCDICGTFEYLKVTGNTNIASLVFSSFQTGQSENQDKKLIKKKYSSITKKTS